MRGFHSVVNTAWTCGLLTGWAAAWLAGLPDDESARADGTYAPITLFGAGEGISWACGTDGRSAGTHARLPPGWLTTLSSCGTGLRRNSVLLAGRGDGQLAVTRAGAGVALLPAQDQKSILACGSVVAAQNSVTLPSRTWLTLATGVSTDLAPREADSVHSATACSSLASTSCTSSRNVPAVSSASLPKKANTSSRPW